MKTQKITTTNYFDTINKIGFENLPLVLKQSHTVILTKTVNGEDWSKYKIDADLKRMIDLVFKKVEEFLKSKNKQSANKKQKGVDGISKTKKYKVELQFIQRYLNLHNTTKTKLEISQFVDELQASIKSKKIQKTSIVADEILYIQSSLLSKLNHGGSKIPLRLRDSTITTMQNAIQLIAEQNIDKGIACNEDELSGTNTNESKESKNESANEIMSSADFANMQFNTIGLKEKWLDFIGDPSPGFTAMVYGGPKKGKSYLCVDFANYLAINHGKVLYVSKEEFMSPTFAIKLKDKEATSVNLDISGSLPHDLSSYQYVFIDSVTSMKLTPDDLLKLKALYPSISFIYVFQVSKSGSARGTNEYMHNVDVVIEVPEKGIAIQNGRFNQGGQMRIFDKAMNGEDDLSGIKKVKKKSTPNSVIEIITEFSVPLEELAMELIPKDQPPQDIVNLLDNKPKIAEASVKQMALDFIKDSKVKVTLLSIAFNQMDSTRLTTGCAYFDIKLKGTKSELKKIANDDLQFNYNWEDPYLEGINRNSKHNLTLPNNVSMLDGSNKNDMKKKVKKVDWTEPEWLNLADRHNLKIIKKYFDEGDFESAMNHATNCDTVIREEIPPDIWKKMGGQLTKSGEEKLKAMKNDNSKYNNRSDDLNPTYMLSTIATQLISEALRGDFDINYLLRKELANRGLDINGKWVGFDKAKEMHKL